MNLTVMQYICHYECRRAADGGHDKEGVSNSTKQIHCCVLERELLAVNWLFAGIIRSINK